MFNIQFNFNPETSEITKLKVIKIGEKIDDAILTVGDNKLILSKSAVQLLDIEPNDRVTIAYYTVNEEETFPVIGKSELFTDRTGGNRLTKSNTVSFRGEQREILTSEYGSLFKLESFKKYFKMVPITKESENDDLLEEEADPQNLNEEI